MQMGGNKMNSIFGYFHNIAGITQFIVEGLFYMSLLLGIWLIFSDAIISYILKSHSQERYRNIKIGRKTRLYCHIELLLNTVTGRTTSGHVYLFFVVTGAILIIFLIILSGQSSLSFTFATSITFALFPYMILQLKLRNLRVEGSFEGEMLVSELLNQYKINYFNMVEAIDKSIGFLNHAPISQKLLFRLSMQLKTYKTEEELSEILTGFTYGIDTEWIKLLSNNIHLAIEDGINVTAGIEDILKECRQIKSMIEQNKRVNSEGFAIITLLSPAMYIATVWIAIKYFNFTIEKFIKYQFFTEIGFRFFAIILMLMFINYGAMTMIKKHKFDY